ncbi:MAG: transcriptional repressor [Planctomycetota bacterium]
MEKKIERTDVDEVRRELNRAGRRMTPQRAAVLAALDSCPIHPTAEDIYAIVVKDIPRISLGTIYRNLQVLVAEGYANRLPAREGSHRYDRVVAAHHHIVCRECSRIVDIHLEDDPDLRRRVEEQSGFAVRSHRTEFEGVCEKCSPEDGAG